MRPDLLSPTFRACVALLGLAGLALTAAPDARADGPSAGQCIAATESAISLRASHKLRAAKAQLLVCASASCPADMRNDCIHGIDELSAAIPLVVFGAKDASGVDLNAVKVTMDGEVLASTLEGTPLAVDPGPHTFTFESAGLTSVTTKLTILQGQKDRREAIVFPAAAGAAPPVTPPPPPPVAAPTSQTEAAGAPAPAHSLGTQKILAIVSGGVGVVGLGVGAAFGAIAISKKSTAQGVCPSGNCPTAAGSSDWSSALTAANVSNVGFIVGALGVAGGAVLWFTAPKASNGATATAQVGVGPGAIQLRGTW